ncbi:hypothetical protein ACS0TY_010743 [Phlomoides rotata]
MKVNILAPLPAKYVAPRKSNDKIDFLKINNLLHYCAEVGGCFNTIVLKRLKKSLYDAFEIPEDERRM